MFTLSDFDFDLPPELIAQTALPERTASRLLEVDGTVAPTRSSIAASPSCRRACARRPARVQRHRAC
jgi:S-adenosylmethionine:tRNA ribosyltransferase-isomerase